MLETFVVFVTLQMPPARYDHPYRGRLQTYYGGSEWLAFECRTGGRVIGGCALRARKGQCSVYINSDFDKEYQKAVLRHEIGHCNGWPRNHPN